MLVQILLQVLVAWVVLGLLLYFVSEMAQRAFYQVPTGGLWWRIIAASLPMAVLLRLFPANMQIMFTENLVWTLLQLVLWWVLFWLVIGFQRGHAGVLGPSAYLLLGWLVTLALKGIFGEASGA